MKDVLLFIVFRLIFDVILSAVAKKNPGYLNPLYNLTSKLKRKAIYKWFGVLVLLTICAIIIVEFKLNDILSGIIAGFVISLWELGFKKQEKAK